MKAKGETTRNDQPRAALDRTGRRDEARAMLA